MSAGNGHNRDDGVDRHTRRHLCIKRTWCLLELEHDGPCVEIPRETSDPPDFGPNRGKR